MIKVKEYICLKNQIWLLQLHRSKIDDSNCDFRVWIATFRNIKSPEMILIDIRIHLQKLELAQLMRSEMLKLSSMASQNKQLLLLLEITRVEPRVLLNNEFKS